MGLKSENNERKYMKEVNEQGLTRQQIEAAHANGVPVQFNNGEGWNGIPSEGVLSFAGGVARSEDTQEEVLDTAMKVLDIKDEDNGDVTFTLRLGKGALKVLIEEGFRAIIKATVEAESQRIENTASKKG